MIFSKKHLNKLIYTSAMIVTMGFCNATFAGDLNLHDRVNNYYIKGTLTKKYTNIRHGDKSLVLLRLGNNYQQNLTLKEKFNNYSALLHMIPLDDNSINDEQTQTIEYKKVDLGMNNVPVLDQGQHGSCVTFAVTAALNAKFNAGDYISQQCMLALGNSEYGLNDQGIDSSGWNGLWADIALNRIRAHGVVSKVACPDSYPNTSVNLNKFEYDYLSLHKQWSKEFTTKIIANNDVAAVKEQLNNGHRVLFATLLNVENANTAMGEDLDENKLYGYWKLPDAYNDKITYLKQVVEQLATEEIGAHEMVIIGYDDELQRFKIRNSWGTDYHGQVFADHGDFYMSYEYYELMNLDAIALI